VPRGEQLVLMPAQRDHHRLPRRAVADDGLQLAQAVRVPVEEQVLLAREVVEHRHLGDTGGVGDLRDGHRVEAATDEQPGRDVRDQLPGRSLLALSQTFLRHEPRLYPIKRLTR